jgi:hypothetical protein
VGVIYYIISSCEAYTVFSILRGCMVVTMTPYVMLLICVEGIERKGINCMVLVPLGELSGPP